MTDEVLTLLSLADTYSYDKFAALSLKRRNLVLNKMVILIKNISLKEMIKGPRGHFFHVEILSIRILTCLMLP